MRRWTAGAVAVACAHDRQHAAAAHPRAARFQGGPAELQSAHVLRSTTWCWGRSPAARCRSGRTCRWSTIRSGAGGRLRGQPPLLVRTGVTLAPTHPAADPDAGSFQFTFKETGHDDHGSPVLEGEALITVVRGIRAATQAALASRGNPRADAVPTGGLSAPLRLPVRDSSGQLRQVDVRGAVVENSSTVTDRVADKRLPAGRIRVSSRLRTFRPTRRSSHSPSRSSNGPDVSAGPALPICRQNAAAPGRVYAATKCRA